MSKEEYKFLKVGYSSFPLRDIGKKFRVLDTIDINIKKVGFIDSKKLNRSIQLHINHREVEDLVWKEIREKRKKLLKEADWLVISRISDFGDKTRISLDILKEV